MTASAPAARPRARWILPDAPDSGVVRALCDELMLPEPICRLLAARGHAPAEQAKRDLRPRLHQPPPPPQPPGPRGPAPAEQAKRYLRPRLDQLLPPEQLLDLGRAVERLVRAIGDGETILVHRAYDVDGISSPTPLT